MTAPSTCSTSNTPARCGSCGDPARALDLARYLVAELANNSWSDHLTVTVAGFARELIDANPTRLAYTDDPHEATARLTQTAAENRRAAAQAGVDVLRGRLHGIDADVWMPHVLLRADPRRTPGRRPRRRPGRRPRRCPRGHRRGSGRGRAW